MLGVPCVPLRLTWLPAQGWQSGSIVVELESLGAAPSGFRWIDPNDVLESVQPSEARPVVRRWLERRNAVVALEPPWARAGWFARTSAWMAERMAEAGFAPTEAPRLVYQGPLAAVLRARSDGQAMFLKCAAPVFAHEASITHALARRTPDLVPAVVASEPDENWLLMRDHGGSLLDEGPEAAWIDAVPRLVELQRLWIGATDLIAAAGGQTRPITDLAAAVPAMLDRDGLGGRLDPAVREAWIGAVPRLVDACAAFIALDVPDTLVHGDLHPGNIVVPPSGPIVVDWSDAAVGNPFIDLATFLVRTKDRDLRRRLVDAYVDGWDGVVPRSRLEAAGELAMTVGSLYQVATYQALLPALDDPDRAMFTGGDTGWLKRTLDALEYGLDAGLA